MSEEANLLDQTEITVPTGNGVLPVDYLGLKKITEETLVGKTPFTATGGTEPRSAADRGLDELSAAEFATLANAASIADSLGRDLFIPRGAYAISADIAWSRSVNVRCARGAVLTGDGTNYIVLTGDATPWQWTWDGGLLDGVGFDFGKTNADYGRGAIVCGAEIKNVTGGAVKYGYNCWVTTLRDCSLHNNGTGVLFAFRYQNEEEEWVAKTNAGASMLIAGTRIFNNTIGMEVNGITADGYNILLSDSDVEHNVTALKTVAAGDGTIFVHGGHWELNSGSIMELDGGKVWVYDAWALSYVEGDYTALFIMSDGVLCLKNMRMDWMTKKFAKFNGGGRIMVDMNGMASSDAIFGVQRAALCTDDSTVGWIQNTGDVLCVSQLAGWVQTANADENTIGKLLRCEKYCSRIEATINIAPEDLGSGTPTLDIFLNPGGATAVSVALPHESGVGHIVIEYLPGEGMTVRGMFNGTAFCKWVADPHSLTTDRFITIRSMGAPGTGSNVWFHDVKQFAFGNNWQ